MRKFSTSTYIKNGYISASKKSETHKVSAHWHDFYEVEFFLSGTGSYNLDGVAYEINDGLIFFMTPTSFHSLELQNCNLYNIMFTENICDINLLSTLTAKAPLIIETDADSKKYLSSLINELIEHKENINYASLLMNAILAKLNLCLSSNSAFEHSTPIKKLEFYMLNHFRNSLTLEDAASYLNLSPTYLSYLFKKETGKNFKTHLNELRFEYAKKLLIFSDMTIKQICFACGFEDYSNFIKRFFNHFGMYPVAFRNAHKKGLVN